jgi:hypothetical protein
MTLRELQSCLDRQGIVLSAGGDRVYTSTPTGVLAATIKAAKVAPPAGRPRGGRRAVSAEIGPSSGVTTAARRRRSSTVFF